MLLSRIFVLFMIFVFIIMLWLSFFNLDNHVFKTNFLTRQSKVFEGERVSFLHLSKPAIPSLKLSSTLISRMELLCKLIFMPNTSKSSLY